jgi:hypothetical protein
MEPYLQYMMATMQGGDGKAELEVISKLPLERRYIWRVASAMKWGFADFDDVTVAADRDTTSPEDMAKLMDLIEILPDSVLHVFEGSRRR